MVLRCADVIYFINKKYISENKKNIIFRNSQNTHKEFIAVITTIFSKFLKKTGHFKQNFYELKIKRKNISTAANIFRNKLKKKQF